MGFSAKHAVDTLVVESVADYTADSDEILESADSSLLHILRVGTWRKIAGYRDGWMDGLIYWQIDSSI